MAYTSYKDLIVWRKAMDLAECIYKLTKSFPPEERYSLTDQMRRAAVSIPSNIAEGNGRVTKIEYARFLSISRGSVSELETQLYLANRIGYLNDDQINNCLNCCSEINKILSKMILSLSNET